MCSTHACDAGVVVCRALWLCVAWLFQLFKMEIMWSGLPREVAHGSLSVDMFDSLTWAWATLGSFFDLQPRASQSSCHSSLTRCLKDNWCQWHPFHGYPSCLSELIIKTLWDSTVSWAGLGLWMFDLTCCLSLSPFFLPLPLTPCTCVCVFVCLCTCVCLCGLFSHSEANYFRGGAHLCGRAAFHVWQAASANLHCLRVAHANHHLALATVWLRCHP